MHGDADVITALNDLLTRELTAINQYYVHYKMCENWGYGRLAKKHKEESMDEMRHADRVIDRILFLDGIPNMQRLNPVKVGENAVEQIQLALDAELENIARLRSAIDLCLGKSDHGTRELFESILEDEEEAVDWLESQQTIIADIGRERWLAEQFESSPES